MAVLRLSVVFLLFGLSSTFGIEDYCSVNTFNNGGNDMHFIKEATNEEFAIAGKFKGLHCCARGYKSIEWYKDGKVYPWELGLSRLIIVPESANQTIYTNSIQEEDEGNYTCVLRNDTVMHSHTINLRVFDKLPDDPKITYVSQDKEASVGDTLRLFCEAFGGRVNLPDAHSEVIWYKKLPNGTDIEIPKNLRQEKSSREDGQTFGTYLVFSVISKEDYGAYMCAISKPGTTIKKQVIIKEKLEVIKYFNPNPFPAKEMLYCSIIIICIITTILVLLKQYGLKMQVYLKDKFGPVERNDGKTHDVLIGYAARDSELALGVLVPNLENKGYKCAVKELSPDVSNWSSELAAPAETCRRLVTVISPATVKDSWVSANLYQALKQLQSLNSAKLICVSLKELPSNLNEPKNSMGETLTTLTRSMNIILWQRSNDSTFWLRLRKELPPRRSGPTTIEMEQQNNIRPKLTSERSFDSLMTV